MPHLIASRIGHAPWLSDALEAARDKGIYRLPRGARIGACERCDASVWVLGEPQRPKGYTMTLSTDHAAKIVDPTHEPVDLTVAPGASSPWAVPWTPNILSRWGDSPGRHEAVICERCAMIEPSGAM